MAINYYTENIQLPNKFPKRKLKQWIKEIAQTHGRSIGNISYLFSNQQKIIQINKEFLNHNYQTDIITFDYSETNTIAGDLCICIDTVKKNANTYKTKFLEELFRVMIHGILHLCKFNDRTKIEKKEMRKQEEIALERLKKTLNF